MPPEERDHAAEREERPEWDRLLPRVLAVSHEQHGRRDEGSEEPDEHRHDHVHAEPGTEERGELHVAHPQPARIDEHDHEEHETGDEGAQNPLEARIVDRAQRENDDRGGENHLVRNQSRLEVRSRDDDEHPAEEGGGQRLEREAEDEPARAPEERGSQGNQPEAARARDRLQERIVERRVGRHAVRHWANAQPDEQPDQTGAHVHVTGFPDGRQLPPEPLGCAVSRPPVQGKPSLDIGWTRRLSGVL
jgi:hypothetical protein